MPTANLRAKGTNSLIGGFWPIVLERSTHTHTHTPTLTHAAGDTILFL